MSLTRVWNITSDPSTDVVAQNLMVMGKTLRPGQSMQIDEKALATAHKVKKDVGLKLLAIGKTAPAYLLTKKKAVLSADIARGHGGVPVEAIAADAPAKVEAKLEEKVTVTDSVETELKPADENKKWKHNRR